MVPSHHSVSRACACACVCMFTFQNKNLVRIAWIAAFSIRPSLSCTEIESTPKKLKESLEMGNPTYKYKACINETLLPIEMVYNPSSVVKSCVVLVYTTNEYLVDDDLSGLFKKIERFSKQVNEMEWPFRNLTIFFTEKSASLVLLFGVVSLRVYKGYKYFFFIFYLFSLGAFLVFLFFYWYRIANRRYHKCVKCKQGTYSPNLTLDTFSFLCFKYTKQVLPKFFTFLNCKIKTISSNFQCSVLIHKALVL